MHKHLLLKTNHQLHNIYKKNLQLQSTSFLYHALDLFSEKQNDNYLTKIIIKRNFIEVLIVFLQ